MQRVPDMQSGKNVVDGNLPRIPQCGAPVVTVSVFFSRHKSSGRGGINAYFTKGVFQSATHDAAGTSGVVPRTGVASGSERGRSRGVYLPSGSDRRAGKEDGGRDCQSTCSGPRGRRDGSRSSTVVFNAGARR